MNTEDSGSLSLVRRGAKRGGAVALSTSEPRSSSTSIPSGALMTAADWDRLWKRDLLAWVKPRSREELQNRQHYVEWVTQLMAGINLRGLSSAELGCGTGLVSRGLYDRHGFSSGLLVDFSAEAIKLATHNARDRNIRVVHADLLTWETEQRFDLVFSIGLIEHFLGDALEAVVRKHASLLNPGGHVLVIVPRRSFFWPLLKLFNAAQGIREEALRGRNLVALCERAGLKVIRLQRFLLGISIGILAQRP